MRIGIEGGLIVAFDGREHRLLRNGIVVYEENTITHVGRSYSGSLDQKIDARKRLIIPGLISLHSHMVGAPFERGYRGDRSGRTFFGSDLYDRGRPFWSRTRDESRIAFQYSIAEMLRGGVTTILELGAADALDEEAVKMVGSSGIRAYLPKGHLSGAWYSRDGRNVRYEHFDGEHWDEEPGLKQLDEALQFVKQHHGAYRDRIRSILYPVQVDTCSPTLFTETRRRAQESNLLITTHLCQSVHEFREMMRRHGTTAIEFLHDLGLLGSDFIAVHTIMPAGHSKVGLDDPAHTDLQLIAQTGTSVAHCPHPFARYGIAMESYFQYLQMGINVGLGLDTWPQDLLREMKLAAILAKIVEGSPTVGTAKDLFDSATLRGAKALKRPDLGRIARGAKADLVLIRTDSFNMCPITDPIYLLVHVATRDDVDTVIIDGKMVVEGGKVKGIDEEKVFEQIQKASDEVRQRVPQKDWAHRTADEINPPSLKDWE